MSDSVKLKKILNLVQAEYTAIYNACHSNNKYHTLEGAEASSREALAAFEPIYQKIMRIVSNK